MNFVRRIPITKRCWEVVGCPEATRLSCTAYHDTEHLCLCVTGTKCQDKEYANLGEKIEHCIKCNYFKEYL